ncbi:MAG: MAPEG family protein [Burkholderiaceae bacterium]|nr:MAPEG family protein [Burkholderiaceae bacterium]
MPITALWCVLIAALLPYVCHGIAIVAGPKRDNHNPRQWNVGLTGLARRADGAQRNHFEAFPFFAIAVLVAMFGGSPLSRIDALALAFVVVRVLYSVCYLADWAWARSLVWAAGFVITIVLFVSPLLRG